MNDAQTNKLRSFVAIEGVMLDEQATLEKYPPVKSKWGEIHVTISELRVIAVEQGTDFRGVTVDKKAIQYEMAKVASVIAGCASSYAKSINNLELAKKLEVSKSKILNNTEEKAIQLSKMVLKECGIIIDKLDVVMVKPQDLELLESLINRFQSLRNKRGSMNSTSKVNTELVDKKIREIMKNLNDHLDKLVNKIEDDEPVFYRKYYVARNIRDLGRGPVRSNTAEVPAA